MSEIIVSTMLGLLSLMTHIQTGGVEDSGVSSSVEPGPRGAAQTEQGEDVTTPETSRPPSRTTIESVGDSDSASEEEEDIPMQSSKKPRKSETSLVARVGKKREKGQQ